MVTTLLHTSNSFSFLLMVCLVLLCIFNPRMPADAFDSCIVAGLGISTNVMTTVYAVFVENDVPILFFH